MKEGSNAKDITVCTDSSANFKKAFIDIDEDDDDFIPLNMISISCACHTIQLALKDLKKEDKFYRSLIQTMKPIPAKMSIFPSATKSAMEFSFYLFKLYVFNIGAVI